jgi:hypothetical protein
VGKCVRALLMHYGILSESKAVLFSLRVSVAAICLSRHKAVAILCSVSSCFCRTLFQTGFIITHAAVAAAVYSTDAGSCLHRAPRARLSAAFQQALWHVGVPCLFPALCIIAAAGGCLVWGRAPGHKICWWPGTAIHPDYLHWPLAHL